jgi:hypothetical protein
VRPCAKELFLILQES